MIRNIQLRRAQQSNNFGGPSVGGIVHGPTVQIAGAPGSLSLAHGVTGSALAGTPEDISGLATGTRKYYHSSDTSIVTVDPDTGVPTGVAAGTATITENLIAPVTSDAPSYTAAVNQHLMLVGDSSNALYADATTAGASSGVNIPHFIPFSSYLGDGNAVDTSKTIIGTGRGGAGEKSGKVVYPTTTDGSQPSGWWLAYAYGSAPNGYTKNYARITERFDLISFNKYFQMRTTYPFGGGNPQWNINGWAPFPGTVPVGYSRRWEASMTFGDEDNTYANGGQDKGSQPVGPFPDDLADNQFRQYIFGYKPHSAQGNVTFGTWADWHSGPITFSSDQTGFLTNGSWIGVKGLYAGTLSSFAGTTATLTRTASGINAPQPDGNPTGLTAPFTRVFDGFQRMWVEEVPNTGVFKKIIDVSKDTVDVIPPGGYKRWCGRDILHNLHVEYELAPDYSLAIGGDQVEGSRPGRTLEVLFGDGNPANPDTPIWWVEP